MVMRMIMWMNRVIMPGVQLSIDYMQLGRPSSVKHPPIEGSLDQFTCGWIDDNLTFIVNSADFACFMSETCKSLFYCDDLYWEQLSSIVTYCHQIINHFHSLHLLTMKIWVSYGGCGWSGCTTPSSQPHPPQLLVREWQRWKRSSHWNKEDWEKPIIDTVRRPLKEAFLASKIVILD